MSPAGLIITFIVLGAALFVHPGFLLVLMALVAIDLFRT